MNRGERRRQERAIANGRLLPEEKEHIRDQQRTARRPAPLQNRPRPDSSQSPDARPVIGQQYLSLLERQRIRDQQKLPKDHKSRITRNPESHSSTRPTDLNAIARAGLVPVLEKRLRHHPGRPSRISITALLLCMVISAELNETYLRTDICSVFNGLEPQDRIRTRAVGPPRFHTDHLHHGGQTTERLERALDETWQSIDGTFHTLDWFAHTWLKATIPRQLRRACTSMSIDWSPVETYAVTKDYTPEEIARQQPHRKYDEPSDTPAIGEFGTNKRMRRGADPHAAAGHRSATNKRPAGKFVGYDAFIGTLAPDYHWAGDINHISNQRNTAAVHHPHLAWTPPVPSPGPIGLNAVLRSKDTLPNLKQVIADSGLTEKRETFNRPLHQLRLDVVKQYHTKVPKPEPVKTGRHQQKLIAYAGMLLAALDTATPANQTARRHRIGPGRAMHQGQQIPVDSQRNPPGRIPASPMSPMRRTGLHQRQNLGAPQPPTQTQTRTARVRPHQGRILLRRNGHRQSRTPRHLSMDPLGHARLVHADTTTGCK